MANDKYTKAALTAIALCLGWLCAVTTSRPLQAAQAALPPGAQRPQPVVIGGWGTIDREGRVTLAMSSAPGSTSTDPNVPVKVTALPTPVGPVDVRLEYSDTRPLPVGITRIVPVGEWAPIRSAVEPDPLRTRPGR